MERKYALKLIKKIEELSKNEKIFLDRVELSDCLKITQGDSIIYMNREIDDGIKSVNSYVEKSYGIGSVESILSQEPKIESAEITYIKMNLENNEYSLEIGIDEDGALDNFYTSIMSFSKEQKNEIKSKCSNFQEKIKNLLEKEE